MDSSAAPRGNNFSLKNYFREELPMNPFTDLNCEYKKCFFTSLNNHSAKSGQNRGKIEFSDKSTDNHPPKTTGPNQPVTLQPETF
jgi:hypothetical protein